MNSLLLIALTVFVVTVVHGQSDEDAWRMYKKKFKKNYNIAADGGKLDRIRKEIFLKRNQQTKDHNGNSNSHFRREVNRYSDMPQALFENFCGVNSAAIASVQLKQQISKSDIFKPRNVRQNTPYKFDQRYDPCMPEVKNQAKCGAAWAFSALTPIEFAFCKQNNNISVPLSEQQLIDCDTGGYDKGCNGGWPMSALDYISKHGIARALRYPYKAVAGDCKYVDSMKAVGVKSFHYLEPQSVVDMKYALVTFGPLSAALAVTDSLIDYADGVYDSSECDDKPVNHVGVIVGWGSQNGNDYWIVRNSWGTGWGIKGYFFIQRGVNKCKIENYVSFIQVE